MASTAATHGHYGPDDGHHHDHHELGFWQKYVFSSDHKVIGIQYGLTGLAFLFFGFMLMLVMRWQLAHPGVAVPVIGPILANIHSFLADHPAPKVDPDAWMPFLNDGWFWLRALTAAFDHNGALVPDGYNTYGAMHGTIMVFFGIVPVAFAAFGNYVVPLQIGAPDMCFPRLNMASYWTFFVSCVIMMFSFLIPGGAAKSGWTAYPPLSVIADMPDGGSVWWNGQTLWLIAMTFNITASLLGSVNFIATIIQLRAPGMTWMRLPFFHQTTRRTASITWGPAACRQP